MLVDYFHNVSKLTDWIPNTRDIFSVIHTGKERVRENISISIGVNINIIIRYKYI